MLILNLRAVYTKTGIRKFLQVAQTILHRKLRLKDGNNTKVLQNTGLPGCPMKSLQEQCLSESLTGKQEGVKLSELTSLPRCCPSYQPPLS